jgi:hypothetical protein
MGQVAALSRVSHSLMHSSQKMWLGGEGYKRNRSSRKPAVNPAGREWLPSWFSLARKTCDEVDAALWLDNYVTLQPAREETTVQLSTAVCYGTCSTQAQALLVMPIQSSAVTLDV